ncbi:MAG: 50S ribosomal protein L18 [Syntrophorhabdaceae bacterium]|nr:50S ribosomal protein L18 [Syntrophorhabdaceae bacterium]
MLRKEKTEARLKRKKRIRKKVQGTEEKPRLCVYKSLNHIYVQFIDDMNNRVIAGVSSMSKEIKGSVKSGGNIEAAKKVGEYAGKKASELGITKVVFDRNGFKYHGRIKALAEAAREAGLIF